MSLPAGVVLVPGESERIAQAIRSGETEFSVRMKLYAYQEYPKHVIDPQGGKSILVRSAQEEAVFTAKESQ